MIIPTRLAVPLLPTLYVLHLSTLFLSRPPQKYRHPLPVLLFSLPSPSRFLTFANLAINSLLAIAALDLLATPFFDAAHDVVFTRLGAVYPDSVKIVARYPAQTEDILLLYREYNDSSAPWIDGPRFHLTPDADWVDTVRLDNLWPSTTYEYPSLRAPAHFRFLATSCITPNFPYQGPLHKHTITGFDHLADYLASNPSTSPVDFMLFLGDFIYADVPAYIGDDQEAYRRLYRRNYLSPSFKKVYEQLPIFHAYDDHEFINNYIGNSQDVPPFVNASSAYDLYAGNANYDSVRPGHNYYQFQHGDAAAFFVLDTRRYRSALTDQSDETYRTMLGGDQLTALYNWLHEVNETVPFKFIVSSVPFTSLWTHDAQIDSWAGYAVEKAALLDALHTVPNVIVISGDRHEFAAIEFTSPTESHVVREISTSPLNMFYIPFIHTLLPESQSYFTRNVTLLLNQTMLVEEEKVPYEKTIAYIPQGNTKWSTFEVDTRDVNKPILRLETVIDGKPAYHLEIVGTPAKPQTSSGLSSLVSNNVKDLFDKIGLSPGRWF
ncbi:hypothetical protein D9613_002827 [Agrocybe pediades]|uniref:PhoD-like phosphatase metallophosphatase domain-containing protein n=1 Tax=Agrocybe pediades TaxID=84607 RepID=A0A8H4QPY7_9AGAR|nr:hypothetical protein D9613_002827 [Agrocybe pediades]